MILTLNTFIFFSILLVFVRVIMKKKKKEKKNTFDVFSVFQTSPLPPRMGTRGLPQGLYYPQVGSLHQINLQVFTLMFAPMYADTRHDNTCLVIHDAAPGH